MCDVETQMPYAKRIPALESETTVYGREHDYVVGDNDEAFVSLLLSQLNKH